MANTLFTLVHGTFAADARWVIEHEDSAPNGFRAKLKQALQGSATFSTPPPWGAHGRFQKIQDLTNAARIRGAENLKKHILNQQYSPEQQHYILAHSHGGNVAMYALQDPDVRAKVDGLICMATPFLFPRQRPLSITTLGLSLAIMTIGMSQFIWKVGLFEGGIVSWVVALALLLIGVLVPAVVIWVIVSERLKRRFRGDPQLNLHIASLSYQDPGIPILLIRNSGDEASGLLRGTQFLNWLAGKVIRIGGRQLYVLVCIVALTLLWMAYRDFAWVPANTLAILNIALIISAAIMVIMLMVLTISRILVGLDAWRWVGELETMIEDGPPGVRSELVVITPRQPRSGLSHTAVYNEPETSHAIADWCAALQGTT